MSTNQTSVRHFCKILRPRNFTYIKLGEGWEGIPPNMLITFLICSCLVLAYVILQFILKRTKDKQPKDPNKVNWLHFIFGDKKGKTANYLKINKRHPLAFLPPILHEYHHLIIDKIAEEECDEHLSAYSNSQISHLDNYSRILFRKPKQESETDIISKNKTEINKNDKTIESNTVLDIHHNEYILTNTYNENKDNEKNNNSVPVIDHKEYILTNNYKGNKFIYDQKKEEKEKQKLKTILMPENPDKDNNEVKDKHTDKSQLPKKLWISNYIFIKDEDILRDKGCDALQYLMFQRYIIYFLSALTFISIFIILPINLKGNLEKQNSYYFRTTINNISPDSNLLWIHSVMTILITSMGVYMMIHFTKVIRIDKKKIESKILYIENIPESNRNTKDLVNYFSKKFPKTIITRINFVYDIRRLNSLKNDLLNSIEAKSYCFDYQNKYNRNCEVRPYCFGRLGGVLGYGHCCPKVDGMKYYTEEKIEIQSEISKEVTKILAHPRGSAFIVFNQKSMADEVYNYFSRNRCRRFLFFIYGLINKFTKSDNLKTSEWSVHHSPIPEDIEWYDICLERGISWIWTLAMNALLLLFFLFLTTPTVAVEFIFNFLPKELISLDSDEFALIVNYCRTLLLMLMTVILPGLVILIQSQIPYRTYSAYNHGLMVKTYFYLTLMVFILPLLGHVNKTIYSVLFSSRNTESFNIECLSPTENSPFFMNYVLQSAFLSNTMAVMRIPELLLYLICNIIFSRSVAEYQTARQKIKFKFYFGTNYPRFLLLFTMIVTYSISSPLIALSGLIYMIYRYLVDRYLIYNVYTPSKINYRIHSPALISFKSLYYFY